MTLLRCLCLTWYTMLSKWQIISFGVFAPDFFPSLSGQWGQTFVWRPGGGGWPIFSITFSFNAHKYTSIATRNRMKQLQQDHYSISGDKWWKSLIVAIHCQKIPTPRFLQNFCFISLIQLQNFFRISLVFSLKLQPIVKIGCQEPALPDFSSDPSCGKKRIHKREVEEVGEK